MHVKKIGPTKIHTFIDQYWPVCMEEHIQFYVLDLQMVIHWKSSQYFVGSNQISVFCWHFDVIIRLAFIMIVTIYNFVNFTNSQDHFTLFKLESDCLRFFKVSYSGVVKHFFLFFLLLTKMLLFLKKIDIYIYIVLMFKSVHLAIEVVFLQLNQGKDFVRIYFFGNFVFYSYTQVIIFKEIHHTFQMLYFIFCAFMVFTAAIVLCFRLVIHS